MPGTTQYANTNGDERQRMCAGYGTAISPVSNPTKMLTKYNLASISFNFQTCHPLTPFKLFQYSNIPQ